MQCRGGFGGSTGYCVKVLVSGVIPALSKIEPLLRGRNYPEVGSRSQHVSNGHPVNVVPSFGIFQAAPYETIGQLVSEFVAFDNGGAVYAVVGMIFVQGSVSL